MTNDDWRIWNRDDKVKSRTSHVESRTYQRVTGELPEMESTKQLVDLISQVYVSGMKILDVGCAAGHYYNGLKRIDKEIKYMGVDATVPYIDFAKNYFKDNDKVDFLNVDIFDLNDQNNSYDIVFCCNLILHLPDFRVPIKNLLSVTEKYCFIRTLISDRTCLNKFLYSDDFDKNGNPTNFVLQNTYNYSLLANYINSLGNYKIDLIEDEFNADNINKEFKDFNNKQPGVTNVVENKQISGNTIFEWKWLKITVF